MTNKEKNDHSASARESTAGSSDETVAHPTRETCPECGGVKMGPIFWRDDAPKDVKICRRGRIVFSGDDMDGYYTCDGQRVQALTFTAGDTTVVQIPELPHDGTSGVSSSE